MAAFPACAAAPAPAGKAGKPSAAPCDKWARSHGSGDRSGVWGLAGAVGNLVHKAGTGAILASFPVIAIFL